MVLNSSPGKPYGSNPRASVLVCSYQRAMALLFTMFVGHASLDPYGSKPRLRTNFKTIWQSGIWHSSLWWQSDLLDKPRPSPCTGSSSPRLPRCRSLPFLIFSKQWSSLFILQMHCHLSVCLSKVTLARLPWYGYSIVEPDSLHIFPRSDYYI